MNKDTRLQEFIEEFDSIKRCCLENLAFDSDDVEELLAWRWEGYRTGWDDAPKAQTESQSYAVVRLKDGRFGIFEESEDYTGHGCQCGSNTAVFETLEEAVRLGLSREERDDFNSVRRNGA